MLPFVCFLILFFLCFFMLIIAYTNIRIREHGITSSIIAYVFITIVIGGFCLFTGNKLYHTLFDEKIIPVGVVARGSFDQYDWNPQDGIVYLAEKDSLRNTLVSFEGTLKKYDEDSVYYTISRCGAIFKEADSDSNNLVTYPEMLAFVRTFDQNKDGNLTSNVSLWHDWQGQKSINELAVFYSHDIQNSKRYKR